MYVYIYAYTYIYIYKYVCVHIGSFFLIGGDYVGAGPMSSSVYISQSGINCDYLGIYIYIFIYMYIFMYMYIYIYNNIYIYII
jgi:hypothetical protein